MDARVLKRWLVTFLIATPTFIFAGEGSFSRPYEAVIITGDLFPQFSGVKITAEGNELYLYAYDEAKGTWAQIPFQLDERGPVEGDSSFFVPDDGLLDANDELCFMPRDGGGNGDMFWIDDIDSEQYVRYKIVVTDPLNPECVKWVYLYRSTTLSLDENLTDYVKYFPSQNQNNDVGADTVRSVYYEINNSKTGFPEDLTILQSKGLQATDILDRLKFRADGHTKGLFTFNFEIDENDLTILSTEVVDGLVRVIRRQYAELLVDVDIIGEVILKFYIDPAFFYPYSVCLSLGVPENDDVVIDVGRMSMDLNESAVVGSFVSVGNPGPIDVDGNPETVNKVIDPNLPLNNWHYFNHIVQGTLVHLFPVSTTLGGTRELFYKDDSSIDETDTGDKMSYGETGVEIRDGLAPPFAFVYKGYFLNSTLPSSIASDIAEFERTPFTVISTEQDISSVPVELVSFSAFVEQSDVRLTWLTATETNNFGFDIARKDKVGVRWDKIAFLPGHGTTTIPVRYEYVDTHLKAGIYEYRLKQIDTNGSFEYSEIVTAIIGLPERFALFQNYPNPFNPSTTIEYEIPASLSENSAQRTMVSIYNILGDKIRELVDEQQSFGQYAVVWDGKDNAGRSVGSGVYLYRVSSGNFTATKKMILIQ